MATTVGTAAYMAPEQVEGRDVTPSADVGRITAAATTGPASGAQPASSTPEAWRSRHRLKIAAAWTACPAAVKLSVSSVPHCTTAPVTPCSALS